MYRLLMPVDTDEDRALGQAAYVASLPNAAESVEAVVQFVFQEDDEDVPDELEPFSRSADRIGSVRRAREFLEERGVAVEIVEDSAETVENILDEAERYDVQGIVLGGRKRSPVGKALFGSVTQQVILNTDLPVTVAGSLES